MIGATLLVTTLSMLIAFVTSGTVAPEVVQEHTETILAQTAQAVLGRMAFSLVVSKVVIPKTAVINTTIFPRQDWQIELRLMESFPRALTEWKKRERIDLLHHASLDLAFIIQFTGSLARITEFSSLIFLFVLGMVNLAAYRHGEYPTGSGSFAIAGCNGCWLANGMLIMNFYQNEPYTLLTIAVISINHVFQLRNPHL